MPYTDVLWVGANKHDDGEDYFIGDVHGSLEELKKVISKLGEHDRLFIAGDLTDRGPESFAVINTINEFNKKRQQIYVARGNHEEAFLQYHFAKYNLMSLGNFTEANLADEVKQEMKLLESEIEKADIEQYEMDLIFKAAAKEKKLVDEKFHDAYYQFLTKKLESDSDTDSDTDSDSYLSIIDKNFNELHADLVVHSTESQHKMREAYEKLEKATAKSIDLQMKLSDITTVFEAYTNEKALMESYDNPYLFGRKTMWADELTFDQASKVANFISSLPYIISSPDFNIVHADLPMKDEELRARMGNNIFKLSEAEKYYVTNARVVAEGVNITIKTKNESLLRTALTVCGHSIGEGVRLDGNHINLDIGTFAYGSIALLHFKKRKVEILGRSDIVIRDNKTIADVAKEIEIHINLWSALRQNNKSWMAAHTRQFAPSQSSSPTQQQISSTASSKTKKRH